MRGVGRISKTKLLYNFMIGYDTKLSECSSWVLSSWESQLETILTFLGKSGIWYTRVVKLEIRVSNHQSNCRRKSKGSTKMIEVVLNDRLGKKVRVKCNDDDTIGDLKKLVAAQTGTRAEKIRIQKWYNIYKDHITLKDYEIHDGMGLELYYN
ncbi:hypothetical protein L1987_75439 [Smallanthus sonchifolius]|uniref:Uncharacterized protein n=1 Tax=Smallanthus sonchifolius TaxID=185202 RepID=A0ACB9A9V3_9ASTR|nr:hypothetical protein L1987_75439 [Smallanthus sonchifolius]